MEKKMEENSRRAFLKKAAYVAPTIVALGSITKPISAMASGPTTVNPGNSGGSNNGGSGDDRPKFGGGIF